MIKKGDNVILKFSTWDGELSRYKGKAYIYESMENATKYCYHHEELVEYTPVKNSYWEYDEKTEFWGNPYRCAACNRANDVKSNYCPNCGANMSKES